MDAARAWAEERLAPVVLVAGTPAAEALVAGPNGLSLVDLLRPQARVSGMNGARAAGALGLPHALHSDLHLKAARGFSRSSGRRQRTAFNGAVASEAQAALHPA